MVKKIQNLLFIVLVIVLATPVFMGTNTNKANAVLYSPDDGFGPSAGVTVTPLGNNDFSIHVAAGHLDRAFNCTGDGGTGHSGDSSADGMATGQFGVFLDPIMYDVTSGHNQGGTAINSEDFPTSPGPPYSPCPVGTSGSGTITDANVYTTTFHLPAGHNSFDVGYYVYHEDTEIVPPSEIYYTDYFAFQQLYHFERGFTCTITPSTATVDPGADTTFVIKTTAQGGFNSPVTFSANFSPNSGTPPTVLSYANNNVTPPGTTTVNIGTTSTTTPGSYTITFTGAGGGVSNTCNTQLVVNSPNNDFHLTLAPSTHMPPNGIGSNTHPNRSNIGVNVVFDVFAECTGGFAGPVTSLTASTEFTNIPTPTLGSTTLACGATTTLTVSGTASLPAGEISTYPWDYILKNITVTGQGQL